MSDTAQVLRGCREEQLLLLKAGGNIQGDLHQYGNWGERRRPSPGIKKKVLDCQKRTQQGGGLAAFLHQGTHLLMYHMMPENEDIYLWWSF